MIKSIATLIVVVGLIAIDQTCKLFAITHPAFSRDVFGSFVQFVFTTNDGIAFGLQLPTTSIVVLTIAAMLFLFFLGLQSYRRGEHLTLLAIALMFGGAFSNLADRLRYGAVIDYISIHWFSVINLADAMISVGVVLFIIAINWFDTSRQNKSPVLG